MSTESPWLRLSAGTYDSKWLAELPWSTRLIWTEILCHVKKEGRSGMVRVPLLNRWCAYRDIPIEPVQELLAAAVKAGAMIVHPDGTWIITNWKRYQTTDDTSNERVTRFRNKKRQEAQGNDEEEEETPEQDGNGDVTVCNAVHGGETVVNGVSPSRTTSYNLQSTTYNNPQSPQGGEVDSSDGETPDGEDTDPEGFGTQAVVARIAKAFAEITGRKFQTNPSAAIWRNLRGRVSEVKVRERSEFERLCIEVIQLKTSQWKDNASMSKYLAPDTLFAAAKFPKYCVEAEEQRTPADRFSDEPDDTDEPVKDRDYVLKVAGREVLKLIPGTDEPFDEEAWRKGRRSA